MYSVDNSGPVGLYSEVWKRLFHDDTIVVPFDPEDAVRHTATEYFDRRVGALRNDTDRCEVRPD
jgi:hypothetical protein